MTVKPPFTDLEINTQDSGFYEGYSLPIALVSKIGMVLLVLWALVFPAGAGAILAEVNGTLLNSFNTFYILSVGAFAFFLFLVAIIPATGKRVLGMSGQKPEFSNFSWFSMMFGAGLGVGLMTFATAEPLGLWGSNPSVVSREVAGNTPEALQSTFRYTFLHYGFHAWAIYVVTGLSLAYYAYTRGMPLTIRSALTPLIGRFANGAFGHLIDVLGVVATILGVSVTIGFGVSQLVDGVFSITGAEWMMDTTGDTPVATKTGLIAALVVIMGMSIISAVSGVGRGVKYLSNLNLVLSLILLMTFVIFGSFFFAMTTYATALIDYLLHFVNLSFEAYAPLAQDAFATAAPASVQALPAEELAAVYAGATNQWGSYAGFTAGLEGAAAALPAADLDAAYAAGEQGRLFGWQAGWTTFYWAWWIAFSPFVGLFLARISRGRTVREFVLGAVFAPALVCFAWMTILGGTAIDLEISGAAEGAIIAASNSAKLFVTLEQMLSGAVLQALIIMCVVLIMTFLVTSADSGILVMNTIMSGGAEETGVKHRIIWGIILTLVIGTLLLAGGGGLSALQNAMIIGALPFTMIMVLMVLSLIKALFNDGRRERAGVRPAAAQPAE
ncbi:glycine/betaine ABC transporter [Roseobacter denitrificans]|uniref:Glycine betaine transporter OpuD, putative n=1 Tax=Roseobacter denitrificans (strain ATCC 33942 / OCh 114) TaxID=375451 RepID=Q167H0_ROSDO|nr:BCCT family transporter [Roseobacter denitrificans]ABG31873.1 glycine betaine transporter OpuD, putative [Roseobacter denitrificans OCh 114]AVL51427.1 glycine/betaine ABC transporter [Roseobacter denitrificans]SFG42675.1 BCCT, betaine/carnitine/choline family transporter [Roseobacter denitrificans OCh 114]